MSRVRNVVGTPLQLPISKISDDVSTFLYDLRQYDKLKPQGLYTNITEFFNKGTIDYGKGYSITFAKALQAVTNYDENATPFAVNKPQMAMETQFIQYYEVTTVSLSTLFPRETFDNGMAVNRYLSLAEGLLQKSLEVDLHDNKLEPKIRDASSWANKTIIPWDVSPQTEPNQKIGQKVLNVTNACEFIANTAVQYQRHQNNLTDATGVETILGLEDLVMIADTRFLNHIKSTLGIVYSPDKIMELFKCGYLIELAAPKGSRALPTDGSGVCWILDKDKLSIILGYNTSLSNVNGANGITNIFAHRACAVDLFTSLAGEMLSLGTI